MATRDFSKYFLYRWRYVIGYTLIGLLLAGLLIFAGLFLPGGLSEAEQLSAVRSTALNLSDPSTLAIQNMPYYALQAGIFMLFGVSVFTIKLPSLIIALLSAIGLVLLLRRWFRPNIAILASLIAITTSQFLYVAQSGTPSILYIFWPIALLLLGTQITRVKKYRMLWKVLFSMTAALSLYTPLSIYPLVAIALTVALHPHLRNVVRRLRKARVAIVVGVFIALVAPLIWLITMNLELGSILLRGNPAVWPPDIAQNTVLVAKQYFMYWGPSTTELMTPVFGLGSGILVALGAYRLVRTRETTRSYLTIFWIICLIPVLIINPNLTTVTFVPSVLLLAAGLTSLIAYWYRLFPLNPYARIAGLIPIVILVGALIVTGLSRYIYGYYYGAQVAPLFSKDLKLLPSDIPQLVVSEKEKPFFSAVANHRDNLNVVATPTDDSFVVTRAARTNFEGYEIKEIITNSRTNNGDRFYVMQRIPTPPAEVPPQQ